MRLLEYGFVFLRFLLSSRCFTLSPLSPAAECHEGESVVTSGFHLPAQFVIHTVPPVCARRTRESSQLISIVHCHSSITSHHAQAREDPSVLASCIVTMLNCAKKHFLHSIVCILL